MPTASLPFRHLLLALVVVFIWGSNFVAIKVALDDLPPLLLCALRFILVPLPAVFFLPRPQIPWRKLILYGMTMFALHFGFLFVGIALGMTAGLTSLVLQFQVFVTLALAATVLKERITRLQILGAGVALGGFAIVALHTGGEITMAGLTCVLLGATSWGCANLVSKQLGRVNPLSLVVWGSLVVPIPMLLASWVFEGPALIWDSLTLVGAPALGGVAFIVYGSTLIAYSLWSWLLSRHPASQIAPFSLLIPIIGMITSALFLGEAFPAWKLHAAALVLAGLAINVFAPRLTQRFLSPRLAEPK